MMTFVCSYIWQIVTYLGLAGYPNPLNICLWFTLYFASFLSFLFVCFSLVYVFMINISCCISCLMVSYIKYSVWAINVLHKETADTCWFNLYYGQIRISAAALNILNNSFGLLCECQKKWWPLLFININYFKFHHVLNVCKSQTLH